jgi:cyclopropane fatty-acyl-phospholipid synthase-like methyltransferase
MARQETEGLFSPLVRAIRMREIAKNIKEDSVILDLACGDGYLGSYLPKNCEYYGVDLVSTSHRDRFSDFMNLDLLRDDSPAKIHHWLEKKVDYITCVAFLEHILNPAGFLKKYRPLLNKKGRIVGTTPHPRGRSIHDSLSRVRLLSRLAALEHEQFLDRRAINEMAMISGGQLIQYKLFFLGLNQLFVIDFSD